MYVPVCLNFWADDFWEQKTILKNCLGIDSNQKPMDSHKKYPPLGVEVISEFEEFEEFKE